MSSKVIQAAYDRFLTKFWGYVLGSTGNVPVIDKKYPSGLGAPAFDYAGTGPGIDCSHFVQQSVLAAGYNVPYLIAKQLGSIVQNDKDPNHKFYQVVTADPQPNINTILQGDILVFRPKNLKDDVWHVGFVTSISLEKKDGKYTGYLEGTYIGAQSGKSGLRIKIPFSTDPNSSDYWGGVNTAPKKGPDDHHSFIGVLRPAAAAYNPDDAAKHLNFYSAIADRTLTNLKLQPYFDVTQSDTAIWVKVNNKPYRQWKALNGTIYKYYDETQYDPINKDKNGNKIITIDKGTLVISGGVIPGNESIAISNFDLNKALNDGYMGIHLKPTFSIFAGTSTTSSTQIDDQFCTSKNSPLQTFTVKGSYVDYLNPTSVQITLKNGTALMDSLKLGQGDNILSFGADGTVTVTIPPGQDSVALTLIDTSNTHQVDNVSLAASITNANGTVSSNSFAITFDNTVPVVDHPPVHHDGIVYHGEYALATVPAGSPPPVAGATPEWNPYGGGLAWIDSNGNWVTDSGTPAPDRTDFIYGSAGDDVIYATKYESVSAGKNPSIAGPDWGAPNYVGGNTGNDTIIGGGIVTTGDGNNTIIYNSQDIPLTAKRIGVGNGNNAITITANKYKSDGSYVGNLDNGTGVGVTGGNGNNTITFGGLNAYNGVYLGNGNNQIYAGSKKIDLATALAQQKATPATGGLSDGSLYYLDKNLVGTGASPVRQRGDVFAVANGNNTIIGGANNTFFNTGTGNNEIVCGNGSNIVFTGADFHGWTNVSALEDSGYAAAATLGHQYHGMMAPDKVDGDSSFTDPFEGFFRARGVHAVHYSCHAEEFVGG